MVEFFKSKWKYLVVIVGILLVASLGSIFVNIGMEWFSGLDKPSNFVPSAVFGIVWTVIYLAFAIILCIWISRTNLDTSTMVLLILNGILNVVWCLFFFALNNTLLGLIAIIINLILAFLLIINIFRRVSLFGYILSIYPLWISIATSLNLALWILN